MNQNLIQTTIKKGRVRSERCQLLKHKLKLLSSEIGKAWENLFGCSTDQ